MTWINTRFDESYTQSLGLWDGYQTWGYPISVYDPGGNRPGQFMRAGVRWQANGHHIAASQFGSIVGSCTQAEIDMLIRVWKQTGINSISLMQFDAQGQGLVISGGRKGAPITLWDNGYRWTTNKNWTTTASLPTAGGPDYCINLDITGGLERVWRKYVCVRTGAGSTSSTGGPQGTGTFIQDGDPATGARWDYVGPACSAYNEEFFTGNPILGTAGLDYFLNACGAAGIYVALRFDNWNSVWCNKNAGATGNSSAGEDGNEIERMRMMWPLDGTGNTPDIIAGTQAHLDNLLDRVNSVNSLAYKDDHTICMIDMLNEQGVCFAFYNVGSNLADPKESTWDRLCRIGSTNLTTDEPNAYFVAWWDAAWLAWFNTEYSMTPVAKYGGVFGLAYNTLPTRGTTVLGPNIAARPQFSVGTNADYRTDVNKFLRETETNWFISMRDYIEAKSSHILTGGGQSGWVFTTTQTAGRFIDTHNYLGDPDTDSNSYSVSVPATSGRGVTWTDLGAGSGPLTITFGSLLPTGFRAIDEGMPLKLTSPYTGPATYVAVGGVVGDVITTENVPDPGVIAGTKVACTVNLPTCDQNDWPFHLPTAAETSAPQTTRMPYYDASGTEVYYDRATGWLGDNGLGVYSYMPDYYFAGLPTICSERGMRGLVGPVQGMHHLALPLLDKLNGGSGASNFTWNFANVAPVPGENEIPGNGASFLEGEIIGLIQRYVGELPDLDKNFIQVSDIDANFGSASPDFGFGFSCAYNTFNPGIWRAILNKTPITIVGGTTNVSTESYSNAPNGWIHPDLDDELTGLFYVWFGMGCVIYSNSKIIIIFGRMPRSSSILEETGVPTSIISRLSWTTADSNEWYGRIVWSSLDGTDLRREYASLQT